MIFKSLPDLYRYRITELPKQKFLAGAGLITLICLVLFSANYASPESAARLVKIYFYLQGLLWVVWAPTQCASAISSERSDRTWDFQRLTPLTSGQTTLGRLLGAPMFPYVLGLLILPWAVLSLFFVDSSFIGTWLLGQLGLLGITLFCNSMSLMLSANSSVTNGRAQLAMGSLLGFALLSSLSSVLDINATQIPPTAFYSFDVNPGWLFNITAIVFGLWIFFGAKWQIGRDYLEPRRAWRFPTFILFSVAYFNGLLSPENFCRYVMVGAAVLVFIAALSQLSNEHESLKEWAERLRLKVPNAIQAIPNWLTGWAALCVAAIAFSFYHRSVILLPLIFFSLRDLLFVEASRYLNFKQARMISLSIVLGLYLVPVLLVKVIPLVFVYALPLPAWAPDLFSETIRYPFIANYDKNTLFTMNLGSGIAGALIAGGLLWILQNKRKSAK